MTGGGHHHGHGGKGFRSALVLIAKAFVVKRFAKHKIVFFIAKTNKEDLLVLNEMVDSGRLNPVVDRTFPLTEAAEAYAYLEKGHAHGKIVITIDGA